MIKEIVDIMVSSGMKDTVYKYVVIDDGWEEMQRDSTGNLNPIRKNFL